MNVNLNGFGADCPAEQPQAALQISLPFLDKAVCACACASRHAHTGYGCAWSVQHSHNYRSNLWPWDEMQANSCRKKAAGNTKWCRVLCVHAVQGWCALLSQSQAPGEPGNPAAHQLGSYTGAFVVSSSYSTSVVFVCWVLPLLLQHRHLTLGEKHFTFKKKIQKNSTLLIESFYFSKKLLGINIIESARRYSITCSSF